MCWGIESPSRAFAAETTRYVGAVGGALDFIRGAARANDGRAIMVLPSMAR